MSHVADGDGDLLLDVGEEWSLVVDEEVEDTVLVRQGEGGGVGVRFRSRRGEVEAMERREHGDLELEVVGLREAVRAPAVPDVFGEGNSIGLAVVS